MPGTPGRSGGSNRRTTAHRSAAGTARRNREAEAPPVTAARPARPPWLTDPIAVEAWDRVADLLEAREVLTDADGDAILLAAVAEAEYRKADALIEAEGLVTDGRAHPAAKIRESAWKRWSAALSRLGLDPITRGRVVPAPPATAANPFAQFSERYSR